jgi:hypothetical protein
VGGVSEGPTRRIRSAEQSDGRTPDAGATVEGIPICGMALTFAGQRRNAGLGSVRRRERVSSRLGGAPATTDVQRSPRKGTTSACTLRSACTGNEKRGNAVSRASAEDASFSWSSDPCTSIATATSSGQLAEVARSDGYRGRENLVRARRNRHRGSCERSVCGSPSVTAPAREKAWEIEEKEERHGARPCEDRESSGLSARMS